MYLDFSIQESSVVGTVRPLFLGRRGAGIIKNSGRRIIIYASNYYARGGASLYMQVITIMRVRKDAEGALINIHTNEGA
jgi:hypothetical protein